MDTLLQVLEQEPVPPRKLDSRIPRELNAICLKALRKEPALRYESAQAFVEDLQRYLEGRPIKARAVSLLARGWNWIREPKRVQNAGLMMIVTASFYTVYLSYDMIISFIGYGSITPLLMRTLLLICSVALFTIWIGIRTMARKAWAIWIGFAMSICFSAESVFHVVKHINDSDNWLVSIWQTNFGLGLVAIMSVVQFLLFSCSLIGYHTNRDSIQWSLRSVSK